VLRNILPGDSDGSSAESVKNETKIVTESFILYLRHGFMFRYYRSFYCELYMEISILVKRIGGVQSKFQTPVSFS